MRLDQPSKETVAAFADELRKWWSFTDTQQHTHSWHSREDFIERRLPALLAAALSQARPVPDRVYLPLPAADDALGYATRLAEALWEKHWKADAPQWKPLPELIGVLTQIDNATSNLVRPAADSKRPVAFRVQGSAGFWSLFHDEEAAHRCATNCGTEYQGLYVRDGSAAPADRAEECDAGVLHWEAPRPPTDRAEIVEDARRYRRLQILGCAPGNSPHLDNGTVLRFTGLDAFVDEDLKRHPSRGEDRSLASKPRQKEE